MSLVGIYHWLLLTSEEEEEKFEIEYYRNSIEVLI